MAAHEEMLDAAKAVVQNRSIKELSPREIIDALIKGSSTYKKNTIYAEMLRCCINCPRDGETPHHYFKRIKYGRYRVLDDLQK